MISLHPLWLLCVVLASFLAGVVVMLMLIGWLMFRAYGVHQVDEVRKIQGLGTTLTNRMAWWIRDESWFETHAHEMVGYFLDVCVDIETIQRQAMNLPPRTIGYDIESLEVPENICASKFLVRLLLTTKPEDT